MIIWLTFGEMDFYKITLVNGPDHVNYSIDDHHLIVEWFYYYYNSGITIP